MTRALHLGASWAAVMRGIYLFTPMWVGALPFSSIVIAQSVETRSTDDDIQHLDRERIIPSDPYFSYQQAQVEMVLLKKVHMQKREWGNTLGASRRNETNPIKILFHYQVV